MANHLVELLEKWYPERDTQQWVLGTVYKTEGPCYRKPGAMMFFNDLGQQFGLLSGGCLEADIQIHAAKVMRSGLAAKLVYDGNDEDDLSFQLGIGCGGTVYILLQPLEASHNYLGLIELREMLMRRQQGFFFQLLPALDGAVKTRLTIEPADKFSADLSALGKRHTSEILNEVGEDWLVTPITPPLHLLVIGGGVDARPLVALAAQMGWYVSLCDARPANARRKYFTGAANLFRCKNDQLRSESALDDIDAAVVMCHNLTMDAMAIKSLSDYPLRYIALLGPMHRKQQVLELAGLQEQELPVSLAGPAGLDLGGELPETIALSILAECHSVLCGGSAKSLSELLC